MHCGAGVTTFETLGNLMPQFWVQSETSRALAQPISQRGMEIDAARGIVLIGGIVDFVGGRWLGRTAEAWVKQGHDPDRPAERLADIAETDPTVHTGIVAQGFDLATNDTYTALATFSLDPEGRSVWAYAGEHNHGDQFFRFALGVQTWLNNPRVGIGRDEFHEFVTESDWVVEVWNA